MGVRREADEAAAMLLPVDGNTETRASDWRQIILVHYDKGK